MKNYRLIISIIIISLVLGSCKKTKLKNRLTGTWNVTEVQISATIFNLTYSETDSNPVGTITFNNNGIASQNYSFKFLNQTVTQDGNFSWEAFDDYLLINGEDRWERLTNEKKKQIATIDVEVNANDTRTYTLTLEK